MKKTLLTLAAGAFLLSFASCKKDYTCTCSYTLNGQSFASASPLNDVTRGDAHDACDALETTARVISSNAECEVGD